MTVKAVVHEKAHIPTGTTEELQELGLDLAQYQGCAQRQPDGSVRGCEWWDVCNMPYKGLLGLEEDGPNKGRPRGGPKNHGIYYVAPSGASLQDVRTCYQYFQLAPEVIQSGGIYEIIADEGEEILIKGTEQVPVLAAAPGGKQRAKPFERLELVPYLPRPKEIFHDKAYELKVRQVIAKREQRRRRDAALEHAGIATEIAGAARVPRPEPKEE